MTYQYQPGDVVRLKDQTQYEDWAGDLTVTRVRPESLVCPVMATRADGMEGGFLPSEIELVRYADGFIPWSGGDNPVPGKRVKYRRCDGAEYVNLSDMLEWHAYYSERYTPLNIVAYKVIDDALAQSKDYEPGLETALARAALTADEPHSRKGPHDYKVGDRIRITAEFTVSYADLSGVNLSHVSLNDALSLTYTELADLKPERLEPLLRVGDKVKTVFGEAGAVVALHGSEAWVAFDGDDGCATYSIRDLERA